MGKYKGLEKLIKSEGKWTVDSSDYGHTNMNLTYVLTQSSNCYVYRDLVRRLKEKTHLNKAKHQKEENKCEGVLPTQKITVHAPCISDL